MGFDDHLGPDAECPTCGWPADTVGHEVNELRRRRAEAQRVMWSRL